MARYKESESKQIRKASCSHNNTGSVSGPKGSEASIHARKEVAMAYGKLVTYRGTDQKVIYYASLESGFSLLE